MNFVITFEEKEYSSDGTFEAYVSDHHDKQKTKHTRRLSIVEIIAIGSCATLSLLGSAVFVWKYFVRQIKMLSSKVRSLGVVCLVLMLRGVARVVAKERKNRRP